MRARTVLAGRANDARPDWDPTLGGGSGLGGGAPAGAPPGASAMPYGRDVKLEYRDSTGAVLTTKEAYRELCYKFHGTAPSQKTRDKRMRAMAREQMLNNLSASEVKGSAVSAAKVTEVMGTAYLKL